MSQQTRPPGEPPRGDSPGSPDAQAGGRKKDLPQPVAPTDQLVVQFAAQNLGSLVALNTSGSSIFLQTPTPQPPGAEITVIFSVGDQNFGIPMRTVVQRSISQGEAQAAGSAAGIVVRFIPMEDEDRQRLEQFVIWLRERETAAPEETADSPAQTESIPDEVSARAVSKPLIADDDVGGEAFEAALSRAETRPAEKKAFVLLADASEYSYASYGQGAPPPTRQTERSKTEPLRPIVAPGASTQTRRISSIGTFLGFFSLLTFFLPWVTIDCNGTKLASQSGFQVLTGNADAERGAAAGVEKLKPGGGWWLLASILGALAASVMLIMVATGRRAMQLPALIAAGVALAGLILTPLILPAKGRVTDPAFKTQARDFIIGNLPRPLARRITAVSHTYGVKMEHGYWAALLLLILQLAVCATVVAVNAYTKNRHVSAGDAGAPK